LPPSQRVLTISSTAAGNVTTPGEGVFTYDAGTVVNLVAEPEEGYPFVNWTGDVGTIADVNAAVTNVTMNGDYSITANFVGVEAGNVGIKAGDWIKVEYKITGWPAGQPYLEWLKLEFLSVEGTSANTRATMHMSDGTEQSDTVPVDLKTGGGEAFGLSEFVIPANLTIGDSIYRTKRHRACGCCGWRRSPWALRRCYFRQPDNRRLRLHNWVWQCSNKRRNYKNLCGSTQNSSLCKLFAVWSPAHLLLG
jgi:hypothetical protein